MYDSVAPNFTLTIVDGVGSYLWYEFLNLEESSKPIEIDGIHNETITKTFNQKLWSTLSNGSVTIRFYVVNSLGKLGRADVVVQIGNSDHTIDNLSI